MWTEREYICREIVEIDCTMEGEKNGMSVPRPRHRAGAEKEWQEADVICRMPDFRPPPSFQVSKYGCTGIHGRGTAGVWVRAGDSKSSGIRLAESGAGGMVIG